MTLDEALDLARNLDKYGELRDGIALARFILDNLGEAQPCGIDPPAVDASDGAPQVHVPDEWGGFWSPDDARRLAAMLLRAADEADAHPGDIA